MNDLKTNSIDLIIRSFFYFHGRIFCSTLTKNLLCSNIINVCSRSINKYDGNFIGNIFDSRLSRLNNRFFCPAVPRCQCLKTDVTTEQTTERKKERKKEKNVDLPRRLNVDVIKIFVKRFGSTSRIINRCQTFPSWCQQF